MNFWIVAASIVAGYAACWFTKDWVTGLVVGVETQVRAFEDKIKALKGGNNAG